MTAPRLHSRVTSILVGVVLVLATLTTLPVTTAQAASPTTERVVTLTPKKTNYVSKASPKKVYSKKSTIRASKAAYASYLEFAPIKLKEGESIVSASLQVHVTSLTGKKKAQLVVAPVKPAWSAAKLTYKKRPKLVSGLPTAAKTVKAKKTTKVALDTGKLSAQLQAGAAFRLTNKLANSSILMSGKGAKAPKLIVTIRTGATSENPLPEPDVPPGSTFSIAVIPDTQEEVFSASDPRYSNRTHWLVDNKDALKLAYVLHTGDNVNWGWLEPSQYAIAKQAIGVLDEGGLPYALTIGNHDTRAVGWNGLAGSRGYGGSAYASNPGCLERLGADACRSPLLLRKTDEFNEAFPLSGLQNVGGVFEQGKVDNTWTTFTAADTQWLVLTLELWPRTDVLDWAEKVVSGHPEHNVIIQTHHYLDRDGTVSTSNGGYGKTAPSVLYDRIVSKYANVKLVFSGHVGKFAKRTDTVNGNTVVSYLGNDLGGEFNPVRILTVNPVTGKVTGRLHDPLHNTVLTAYNTSDTIKIVR